MSDEAPHRLLTEMLTEIGRADLQIDAPGALEERVLRHWDRDVTAKAARIRWKPRTPGTLASGAGALAAAMLLVVLVHRSSRGPIAVGVPVARPEVRAQPAAVNAPTVAVSPPGVETRPIAVARAQPEMKPRRMETPSELVSYHAAVSRGTSGPFGIIPRRPRLAAARSARGSRRRPRRQSRRRAHSGGCRVWRGRTGASHSARTAKIPGGLND